MAKTSTNVRIVKIQLKSYISSISNKKIEYVLQEFVENNRDISYLCDISIVENIIYSIPINITISEITWHWFQSIFDSFYLDAEKRGICVLISRLIRKGLYNGEYKEIVDFFSVNENIYSDMYWLLNNRLSPLNLIIVKRKQFARANEYSISSFKTDVSNLFLYQLLNEFINSHIPLSVSNRNFFTTFQRSLDGMAINQISDFSANSFNKQYWFYKTSWNYKGSNRYISLLKSFYLMLLNNPDGSNILRWQDGIDLYMLQSGNFNEHYEKEFKLIPLNSLDPIPTHDKWLIMPNGAEDKTTKLKTYQYKPMNFSLVYDPCLKTALKHWFWNSKLVLHAR